jgi:hypothetical protein
MSQASRIWKDILKTRPLLKKGSCFRINSATSIRIWDDLWIPNQDSLKAPLEKELTPSFSIEGWPIYFIQTSELGMK